MPTELVAARVSVPPVELEDLDLRRRTIGIMRDVTVRPEVKKGFTRLGITERLHQMLRTHGRRGLEICGEEIVDLRNVGATLPELELYPAFLSEIIGDCFRIDAALSRAELERREMEADAAEDLLQPRGLFQTETPAEKLDRARALRVQAASSIALARSLEGEVRRESLGLMRRPA